MKTYNFCVAKTKWYKQRQSQKKKKKRQTEGEYLQYIQK